MASPREREATAYLRQHQILELLDNLTSMLLYHRPAKPLDFLVDQLEKLKIARQTETDYPCLFDESNLDAVFGILDTTKKGHITLNQYTEALKTLGVKNFVTQPEGASNNEISLATFKNEATAGLMKTCATFKTG
ncbi:EF-hand calcium-binding domain-containing protein 10 [Heptranchias perlo]|uniref:EF-hand calcium-binding domain-containing protein 10 n=1 Tax=Heptranchias perlo TaxID=212740 RepID=UPI003559E4A4